MWNHHEKRWQKQQYTFFFLKKFLYRFRDDTRGAVSIMLIVFFFITLLFVGVAIDYDRYRVGKAEMDFALDAATTAVGVTCRKTHMEAPNTPANVLQAAIETMFQNTFSAASKGFIGSVRVRAGTLPNQSTTVVVGPPRACDIQATYEGESDNIISRILGYSKFYFKGKTKVIAYIDPPAGPLQVDFLLDTSGSMSTVAQPNQRDLIMALTLDPNAPNGDAKPGCLFACHSPQALMNKIPSENVDKLMNGKTVTVNIGQPGRLITLSPPTAPGPLPKKYTLSGDSSGDHYIAYGEALAYMGIKLKSDILTEAMGIALSELKKTGKHNIEVAFHRFTKAGEPGGFNTVFPNTSTNSYGPLLSVPSNVNTLKNYFNYSVPCSSPIFFGAGAVYATNSGTTSIDATQLASELGHPICENVEPHSYITSDGTDPSKSALGIILNKLNALPDSDAHRVVVLITDGVNTPPDTNKSNQITINACQALKLLPAKKRPKIMIIHTYYRLQAGNNSVINLVGRVAGNAASSFNVSTVAATEKAFNEALAIPMRECADFYYPADDEEDIRKAFREMAKEILNIPKLPIQVVG